MSATTAYTIPTVPASYYEAYGERVVNIANYLRTRLYAARGRLDLMRECADRGDDEKAAEHGRRASEYAADIRASIKRHGAAGHVAFDIAKEMEGPAKCRG